jgi:hypothetical protein
MTSIHLESTEYVKRQGNIFRCPALALRLPLESATATQVDGLPPLLLPPPSGLLRKRNNDNENRSFSFGFA